MFTKVLFQSSAAHVPFEDRYALLYRLVFHSSGCCGNRADDGSIVPSEKQCVGHGDQS